MQIPFSMRPSLLATCLLPVFASAQVPTPAFTNVTQQMGIDSVYAPNSFPNSIYGGGGAVGDFDNDGVQELFMMRGGFHGTPDRFYQLGAGNVYVDQAASWGLDEVHNGRGAAVGDFNNDGYLDLYVTSGGPPPNSQPGKHKLFKNNGNGTFTDIAAAAGVNYSSTGFADGWGAAFGDYDLDGDLDLFVTGHAAGNDGSRLFRNNGDETFTDVTSAIGLFIGSPTSIAGFAPRFLDTNGDRYPELLLAADYGTTRYFRNNGDGTFLDVTQASGVGHAENGMGQAYGDWNSDGLVDWYNSSIDWPSVGWTGSKLYLNQGAHSFQDVSTAAQVFDSGYAWAAISVDFNHDGWEDIAETNGEQSSSMFNNEQSYLYMNVPGQVAFNEMAIQSGFVHTGQGRGMLNFDMDNDGDQDILLMAFNEPAQLFRNDIAGLPSANWIRMFLDTSANDLLAPNGYGTKVTLTIGGQSRVRHLAGGDNYLSYSELSVHFGVSNASIIDELRFDWADGQTTMLLGVAPNQTMTVVAPPVNLLAPTIYCVGKTATDGCLGGISTSGLPSMSSAQPFRIDASNVSRNKFGLLFYGYMEASIPFQGGVLCAQPPLKRTSVQHSGGGTTVGCLGTFAFEFNGYLQSGMDPALLVGSEVFAQYWYRDPQDPFGSALTNAVKFGIAP